MQEVIPKLTLAFPRPCALYCHSKRLNETRISLWLMDVRLLSTFASQMPPSAVGLLADTRCMFAPQTVLTALRAHSPLYVRFVFWIDICYMYIPTHHTIVTFNNSHPHFHTLPCNIREQIIKNTWWQFWKSLCNLTYGEINNKIAVIKFFTLLKPTPPYDIILTKRSMVSNNSRSVSLVRLSPFDNIFTKQTKIKGNTAEIVRL